MKAKEEKSREELIRIDLVKLYRELSEIHVIQFREYHGKKKFSTEFVKKFEQMYKNLYANMDKFTEKWGERMNVRMMKTCYRQNELDRQLLRFYCSVAVEPPI